MDTNDQLLKDPDTYPSSEVLKKECGSYYPVLEVFLETISEDPFGLLPEWRFYNDGKAWLCKISYKKKTVAWMSFWKEHFKVALYFTEKTGAGISDLEIDPNLKEFYVNAKPIGKLRPIVSEVSKKKQLKDGYTLIRYKLEQR